MYNLILRFEKLFGAQQVLSCLSLTEQLSVSFGLRMLWKKTKQIIKTLETPWTKKVWKPLKYENYEQLNAKKEIENLDEVDKLIEKW